MNRVLFMHKHDNRQKGTLRQNGVSLVREDVPEFYLIRFHLNNLLAGAQLEHYYNVDHGDVETYFQVVLLRQLHGYLHKLY